MNTPASKALTQVLELLSAGVEATSAFIISASASSQLLWNLPKAANAQRIIVIWDASLNSANAATTNLSAHLNPLTASLCALKEQSDLRIAILDPKPKQHRVEGGLYRTVESIRQDRMPQLYLASLLDFGGYLLDQFCGNNERVLRKADEKRTEILEVLQCQIRDALIRESGENDRHAIQNIIGPMVLLGRGYLASKGVAEHALLRVFEATGLLPKGLADGSQSIGKINEESWGKQPLRLLLVDDQADCGWTDWVRANLPASNPGLVSLESVDVLASPDALLDRLLVEWRLMGDSKDRRLALQLAASGKETSSRQPVLLLDLRLHSMRSAESEADFIKKLLPLCERFKSDGKAAQFAWPGFSAQEIQSVQQWCEHPKRETPDHLVALSLLPRLIALMDMSLPIIIFSSTGQRSLIEKFKPYGNIITDFEKPRFFGRDARNVIAETHAKFAASVERAVKLAVTRRLSQQMTLNVGMADAALVGCALKNAGSNSEWSAVLYIDESGSARELTLGGILLLLPRGISESEVDKALRATLEQPSSQGAPAVGPSRSKGWCHKPGNLELLLQQIKRRFPTVHICFVSLSAGADRIFDDFAKHDELHDERVADNLWREIFRRLVELSVYAIPSCLVENGACLKSFSIRAPTRVLPASSIGKDSWKQRALFNRWGIDVTLVGPDASLWEAVSAIEALPPPKQFKASRWSWLVKLLHQLKPRKQPDLMIRYFSFDSPRPVVEEVMRLYRNIESPPLAEIVRGFLLNCHGRPAAAHIPILHFAVDGFLYQQNFRNVNPLIRVTGYYGRNLELLLESNRCTANGDRIGAILSASAAEFHSGDQIQALLWKRIGMTLNAIDGPDFLRFSYLANAETAMSDDQAVSWQGKVIKKAGSVGGGTSTGYWGVIEDQRGKQVFAPTCPADVGDAVTFRPMRDKCPGEIIAADVKKI